MELCSLQERKKGFALGIRLFTTSIDAFVTHKPASVDSDLAFLPGFVYFQTWCVY